MRMTGQSAALIGLGVVAFVNNLGQEDGDKVFIDEQFEAFIREHHHEHDKDVKDEKEIEHAPLEKMETTAKK